MVLEFLGRIAHRAERSWPFLHLFQLALQHAAEQHHAFVSADQLFLLRLAIWPCVDPGQNVLRIDQVEKKFAFSFLNGTS